MFSSHAISSVKAALLAGTLAGSVFFVTARAQAPVPVKAPAPAVRSVRYTPNRLPKRAELYYGLVWGVDSLSAKWTEQGEVIRFSWRVVNPEKAKPISDKKFEPELIDPQAGVKLVVPSLEKVGQLRQTSTPEAGRAYWMAFSNKGRPVKRGDRVTVVIGSFRAEGLVVE